MKTYHVSFDIEVPDDVPADDVEAFLRFELHEVATLSGDNALAHTDLASFNVSSVWVS